MAVEWLHGCVDVEYPRLGEKRRRAIIEMPLHPRRALIFADRREGTPHGVLANDLVYAEKFWKNAIATERRDMGVTLVPRQHRQHRRSQHIAFFRRVRARVMQRTICHESVKQAGGFQKIDEERQLPKRRQRRLGIPFDMHWAGETVEANALRRAFVFNR
jgi:hypothetical protein